MTLLIGLDIGGSKTHGVLFDNGQPVREATADSANIQNVTPQEASLALADLFDRLGPPNATPVVVGAGGIDTADDAKTLKDLVLMHFPGAEIRVVHDSRLILAAAGFLTGIAVIAGTGSAAWGRNEAGQASRFGGWGYLLGDEGSGYWLGREAVRHCLHLMNQGREPDQLTTAMLKETGRRSPVELIALFHSPTHGRNFWARQARCVIDCAGAGDPISAALLDLAGKDLARVARSTARQLQIHGPVVLGGGLGMNAPALQASFRASLAADGIGPVQVLDCPPVYGAPALARSQRLTAVAEEALLRPGR